VSSALRQLGQTQQRLLGHLQRDAGGASVVALSEALGISHNAVRQHLTALAGQGYVSRGAAVRTGGRPEHLYVLTESGRELFPRRYVELASGVIREVGATLGEPGLQSLMTRLGDEVGANLAKQLPAQSVADRTVAVAAALNELGYDARARVESRVPEIQARNCVFHHLAREHPAVCRFDLAFLARASGRRVEHAECMLRGGAVCRFRLLPGSGIDAVA
jgi:predicted ArsR family transcriptional regulator